MDDERTVTGELEFDSLGEAETIAGRLSEIWKGSASSTVSNAGYRITEVLERSIRPRVGPSRRLRRLSDKRRAGWQHQTGPFRSVLGARMGTRSNCRARGASP